MFNGTMDIAFEKNKPYVTICFDENTAIKKKTVYGQKFKKIDDRTYKIATTIIKKVFADYPDVLGKWQDAKFASHSIDKYYGFEKSKGFVIHSLDLNKRFLKDWEDEYTKLMRYTVNTKDDNNPPIIEECLYDAGIYSDNEIGNVTQEEYNCFKKVLNADGDVIVGIKKKLNLN